MTGLHLSFLLALALGVIGMAFSDAAVTFETVAEARGRARLAGVCDGLSDLAGALVTVAGVGSILQDGITLRALTILAAIFVTSVIGTAFWTTRANRMMPSRKEG